MSHPPTNAVLLLHTIPGLPDHHDLLLERPPSPANATDPDDPRLIAFRLPAPLQGLAALDHGAIRTPDHRAHYLTHEGPVPGDRGAVKRVLSAQLHDLHESPTAIRATLKTETQRFAFRADRLKNDRWRLQTRPV